MTFRRTLFIGTFAVITALFFYTKPTENKCRERFIKPAEAIIAKSIIADNSTLKERIIQQKLEKAIVVKDRFFFRAIYLHKDKEHKRIGVAVLGTTIQLN